MPDAQSASALVAQYIAEFTSNSRYWSRAYEVNPADLAAAREILAAKPELQVEVVAECVREVIRLDREISRHNISISLYQAEATSRNIRDAIVALAHRIALRRLPFPDALVADLIDYTCRKMYDPIVKLGALVAILEECRSERALSDAVIEQLVRLRDHLERGAADERKFLPRVRALFEGETGPLLDSADAWAAAALTDIRESAHAQAWTELIAHCSSATTAKPAAKWLDAARKLVARLPHAELESMLLRWLPLVRPPKEPRQRIMEFGYAVPVLLEESNATVLRGLLWCTSLIDSTRLTAPVAETAIRAYKKVPKIGPFSASIGNACVLALGAMNTIQAVSQLCRLSSVVRYGTATKAIERALQEASQRLGQTREDLADLSVPDYSMTSTGALQRTFGDFEAVLTIRSSTSVDLGWRRSADGKPQKSVPASVKATHGADVKALQVMSKEIAGTLGGVRNRIENFYLDRRSMTAPHWMAHYIRHPLTGTLAQKLIWTVGETDVLWSDGALRDVDGREVPLSDEATVSLWHPIHRSAEQVRSWRERISSLEITQPFKQAFREIYVLTDAERRTNTYSNRFAAHILRQHQLAALLQERGWKYALMGGWDGANTPYRNLAGWDLQVEYWIEGVANQNEMSPAGIWLYVSTDQVRFVRGAEAVPLESIPALLFSEVMRDVDLFVGVCSIGNDPSWADGGEQGHFRYWQEYSFGSLSESAKVRHDVLARLVPRLNIADRCELGDRFLIVRGDVRTYRIHLGSGNILMEPNDQYLCIVPSQGAAAGNDGRYFLPFEGDTTLSVILSKAFLLANDRAISDATILRQIHSGD